MMATPGNGACTCLCKCMSGFVAVWELLCAAVLTSHGLPGHSVPAQVGTHLVVNPSIRPVTWVQSKVILHPALVRGPELFWLVCLSPDRQRGPGSSGFSLQAGSVTMGLLQVDRKKLNTSSDFSPYFVK